MFLGSIPPELRSMVHEHAATWPAGDVWVACSGNFTIERVLAPGGRALHSNDVSLYSCALGWWLAGQPVPVTLREESRDLLGWMEPYLDGGIGTVATIMLGTRFLDAVGRDGLWFHRLVNSYERQFPTMHAKTVEKLAKVATRVASFHPIDVREYLTDVVPKDGAVCSFPPFYAGGYEAMFKGLTEHLDFPAPSYEVLGEDDVDQVLHLITNRPTWLLGADHLLEDLRGNLVGSVQPTPRSVTMYVYASSAGTRISRPRQKTEPVTARRLRPGDVIGDRIAVAPLRPGQFNALRSQYLNAHIAPGAALLPLAVMLDGRLAGCVAFAMARSFDPTGIYLLSDFAVAPTDYPRLSKLIVAVALSREVQLLLQRITSKRVTHISTTAFSNRPASMKYRGLLKLDKRADSNDPAFRFMLNYSSPAGRWSLDEALRAWKGRYAAAEMDTK